MCNKVKAPVTLERQKEDDNDRGEDKNTCDKFTEVMNKQNIKLVSPEMDGFLSLLYLHIVELLLLTKC